MPTFKVAKPDYHNVLLRLVFLMFLFQISSEVRPRCRSREASVSIQIGQEVCDIITAVLSFVQGHLT